MAYSSGGTIAATDYNNLTWGGTQGTYTAATTNLAYVLGIGSGQFGYGQSVSAINTVTTANVVSATQWTGLLTGVNTCLAHQSGAGSILSVPTMTSGGVITYSSALNTAVTTINTNKLLYTAQGTTTTGATFSPNFTVANTLAAQTWTFTRTVAFSSGNAARHFFNAGGKLNFVTISTTNGDATSRSGDWVTLIGTNLVNISAIGAISNSGRSGAGATQTTNGTGVGYWNASTGSVMQKITSSVTAYSGDYVQISLRTNGVQGSNGDVGNIVYLDFTVYSILQTAFPAQVSPSAGGTTVVNTTTEDGINVTWNHRIDIVYPESTYLTTNSWGTPTIT